VRALAILAGLIFSIVAAEARAGCCRVVKVDPETPPVQVRVCEPQVSGECGNLLFLGTLALGESENVCSAAPTVVYQEYDDLLAAFGPPTVAVCDGGDVEL
jgi:hypothetical protein